MQNRRTEHSHLSPGALSPPCLSSIPSSSSSSSAPAAAIPRLDALAFATHVRAVFHGAYGDASELPPASWAEANFVVRNAEA